MLLLCFYMLSGNLYAQVSISRPDSLSYENYLRMLNEEAKIPLSEVQEDKNPEHLKERIAAYPNGDRAAYTGECTGVKRANEYAPRYAVDVIKYAGLQNTDAKALEETFRHFYELEMNLLKEIGPKKFIQKYIVATPKFSHLKILKEAKLREVMDPDDHIRYFLKYILPSTPCASGTVIAKDEFKCSHYIRIPLFAQGNMLAWISQHIVYPQDAVQNKWQGKIVVRFTVEPDGTLSNIHVIKGGAHCLNMEAIRVVKSAPKFLPAWCPIHKRNIPMNMTATVNFRLAS